MARRSAAWGLVAICTVGACHADATRAPEHPRPNSRLENIAQLEASLNAMSQEQVVGKPGLNAVVKLANERSCVSLFAARPDLARETMTMLAQYDAFRRQAAPDSRGQWRIASAYKNAEIASNSDMTVAYSICRAPLGEERIVYYGQPATYPGERVMGIDAPFPTYVRPHWDLSHWLR